MKIFLALYFCSLLFSSSALAGVGCDKPSTTADNLGFGNVTISPDAKVGDVLAETTAAAYGYVNCYTTGATGGSVHFYIGPGLPYTQSSLANVYNTGVAGLGIRVSRVDNGSLEFDVSKAPMTGTFRTDVVALKFELIKTGATTAGSVNLNTTLTFTFQYSFGNQQTNVRLYKFNTGGTNIIVSACKLNASSVNVVMGDILTSDLQSVGAVAPEKSFQIPFECTSPMNMSVTVTAGASGAFDNARGILNLSSSSSSASASGIGIQLLRSGAPVAFNENVSLGSTGSMTNLAFTARYIRTSTAVTAGQADSNATINITYN